ncbi:LOW QUALITY PROTEIN: tubulin-specific chaperone E-like [Xenia sp. Carnegie-2017]|uniref:LOW QUALITY PROTEIN: tubulin-specific chaperone E-like n=1 Tax=Xenia sp. Carnegie-2017 TaxID=2897299 RepID=UPI001F044ECF|nr:LOW QUALITY PROTEIN: tubulin-specific chaperone E-like [Xenia sp. Carnegie-2017]
MADRDDENVLGRRVICDGEYGTVRYFGEVPPTNGLWYGIEWDADGRGKNNGEHNGCKYFTCSRPKSGSFIREKKLDFGVDVVTALVDKFTKLHSKENFSEFERIHHDEHYYDESAIDEILQHVDRVTLSGDRVSYMSSHGKSLGSIAPNIVELDLSKTLLSDWLDVIKIVNELPRLYHLNVSGLRLNRSSFDGTVTSSETCHLRTLVLNYMQLNWNQALALSCTFRGLQELHASFNNISNINDCDAGTLCTSLIKLNLEGNNLHSWNDVFSLDAFLSLEFLIVNGNPLGDFVFPGDPLKSIDIFVKLQTFGLVSVGISKWRSVNQLNRLKVLQKLFLKSNPLFDHLNQYDARQEIISRIANCQVLNSSDVTKKERKCAERVYIKKYFAEWHAFDRQNNSSQSSFHDEHPRYLVLLEVHGPPDDVEGSSTKPKTLKSSLISVTFKCIDDVDRPLVKRKLPATMTIAKLKGLLLHIFKISTSSIALSVVFEDGHELELDDNLKTLSFYSIASGHVIIVKRKMS